MTGSGSSPARRAAQKSGRTGTGALSEATPTHGTFRAVAPKDTDPEMLERADDRQTDSHHEAGRRGKDGAPGP